MIQPRWLTVDEVSGTKPRSGLRDDAHKYAELTGQAISPGGKRVDELLGELIDQSDTARRE
jgi:hypothetical protein